jgi:hypothetical protein
LTSTILKLPPLHSTILAFHHPTCTTNNTITISITISATPNANMTNQEEEEPPKTLESYAALVKQLVPTINMILRDFKSSTDMHNSVKTLQLATRN